MTGRVIKSTGSWYTVLTDDHTKVECRMRGLFRKEGRRTTNPIAVGDRVDFEREADQPTAVIYRLHDRSNYILRRSTNLSKESQILAANIDQAFLLVTLAMPRTSLGFIDRFLVSAEAYHIPTVLVFNKFDLYDHEAQSSVTEIETMYHNIGYPSIELSAFHVRNWEVVRARLQDKTTLLSGHSGVGKSTMINKLVPDKAIKTSEISAASDKGVHTTTFAEMYTLPAGGFIIDTPGISELGVTGIDKAELSHYFPEMRQLLTQCRFNNCTHIQEPGCAVITAVEEDRIEVSRYNSYQSIYFNEDSRA